MLGRHMTLFRLLGFEVKLDLSWIFLAVLVTWTLAAGYFPAAYPGLGAAAYWSMAVLGAAGLFLSIILHEMSHSLVARRYGLKISGITLFIFGGVAEMTEEPPAPRTEFLMAIAGPIASLALAAIFALAAGLVGGKATAFGVVLGYLALINLVLAIFNMVPAFPLDGGRALRAVLWGWKGDMRWATRITASMGFTFGLFLMALGLMSLFGGNVISGLWWGLIGLFLAGAARASTAQLEAKAALTGERVAERMTRNPVTVTPDMELPAFARLALAKGHRLYPVVEGDRLLGQIETKALTAIARDGWPGRTVRDVMTRRDAAPSVAPDITLAEALSVMTRTGHSRLLVVAEGGAPQVVGILVLRDIARLLALKAELHVPEGGSN